MKKFNFSFNGNEFLKTFLFVALAWSVLFLAMGQAKQTKEIEKQLDTMEVQLTELETTTAWLKIEVENQIAERVNEISETLTANYSNEINYDFDYVVRVVGAEARGESIDGIKAVAQTIAQRAADKGITPEQVVKERINGCPQYAAPLANSNFANGETVCEACLAVLVNGERVVDAPIKYFCTPAANKWHRQALQYVCTIGGHEFYQE